MNERASNVGIPPASVVRLRPISTTSSALLPASDEVSAAAPFIDTDD